MKVFSKGKKSNNRSSPFLQVQSKGKSRGKQKVIRIVTCKQLVQGEKNRQYSGKKQKENGQNITNMVSSVGELLSKKRMGNRSKGIMQANKKITKTEGDSLRSSEEEVNIVNYGAKINPFPALSDIAKSQYLSSGKDMQKWQINMQPTVSVNSVQHHQSPLKMHKEKENMIPNIVKYNKFQQNLKPFNLKTYDLSRQTSKSNYYNFVQNKKAMAPHIQTNISLIIRRNAQVSKRTIKLSDFSLGRKIGRGRFGNVFIAQQKSTNLIFALKMVNIKQAREQQMEGQIVEQIKLQMFMNHPNVLKMYTFFRDQDNIYMVLEYANDKCLYKKLINHMEESKVSYYSRQVIEAMKYFHSENILHRDIKPENIMICEDVIKVGDFGWAAYAPKYKRQTFCGTLDYVPPQIIKGDYYDEKVDIWSLGVLLYEMSTGKAPFQSQSNNLAETQNITMDKILGGDLIIPFTVSFYLKQLILRILITNPQGRLSLQEIEKSEWMNQFIEEGTEVMSEIWKFWNSNDK